MRNKMKLDKNLLKSIVKECLVEILAEGIVNTPASAGKKKRALSEALTSRQPARQTGRSIEGTGRINQQSSQQDSQQRGSYLDNISYGNDNRRENQENAVSRITKSITKDALMQDILADTAKTTLQEQRDSKGRGGVPSQHSRPADKAAEIVSKTEPQDLFGDSAKNWETLAFS